MEPTFASRSLFYRADLGCDDGKPLQLRKLAHAHQTPSRDADILRAMLLCLVHDRE